MFGNNKPSMNPIAQVLMQRAMQQQGPQSPVPPGAMEGLGGPPPQQGGQPPMPGQDPAMMGQDPAMGGDPMGMKPMGMGKPMPPPDWQAPGPTGGASDILQSMAFQNQGNNNKVKVTDPYGGSQEVTSGPPDPPKSALPGVPPWVRSKMGA